MSFFYESRQSCCSLLCSQQQILLYTFTRKIPRVLRSSVDGSKGKRPLLITSDTFFTSSSPPFMRAEVVSLCSHRWLSWIPVVIFRHLSTKAARQWAVIIHLCRSESVQCLFNCFIYWYLRIHHMSLVRLQNHHRMCASGWVSGSNIMWAKYTGK